MARQLDNPALVERHTQQLRELVEATPKVLQRPVPVPLARPQPDGAVLLPDGSTVPQQPAGGAQ